MTDTNQRAPRHIKNPSGYHSRGKTKQEKVYNFGVHIKQFGWSGKWERNEETKTLYAELRRGDSEVITINWPDDQWWPEVYYAYAGNKQKCRNISAAAKIASEKPDPNRLRKAAAKKRRAGNGIAEVFASGGGDSDEARELIASLSTTLPFDRESSVEDIKAVLKARTNPVLIWINRISGGVEQDYIKTWSRHLKVTENKEGRKIIHFVGGNCFHAVYVDSVIGVS